MTAPARLLMRETIVTTSPEPSLVAPVIENDGNF
jgi:hypothetical protein